MTVRLWKTRPCRSSGCSGGVTLVLYRFTLPPYRPVVRRWPRVQRARRVFVIESESSKSIFRIFLRLFYYEMADSATDWYLRIC
jgi:hypothetical protein